MTEEINNKWKVLAEFQDELQDENIALKQRYHVLSSMYVDLQTENQRLKQENEVLTRENKNRNDWINDLNIKCQELILENEKLKEEKLYLGIDRQFIEDANDKLFYQAEKYRKALEEIREPITRLRDNDYQSMKELEDDINFIQDKINEVLK